MKAHYHFHIQNVVNVSPSADIHELKVEAQVNNNKTSRKSFVMEFALKIMSLLKLIKF
jgi:hypothetical protein